MQYNCTLSAQEGFKSTAPACRKALKVLAMIFIIHPKSHCELNWIAYYWGFCKHFARKHYNHTLPGKYTDQITVKYARCV